VEAPATIVLIFATVVVVLGMIAVMWRELTSQTQRRVPSRGRDVVEVLLPVVGAALLVAWVWSDYV
jgi:VanZ family protein